jgi:putative copper resistance protein D
VDELIVASRAVHFAALALLVGAPVFRLAIAPPGPARGRPGGRTIELAAGAVALASALGWFAGVAAGMAGSWVDAIAPDMLQTVALDTRFGRLWMARLAAILVILAIQALARPAPARDAALAVLAGAVTASLVGTGHGTAGEGALGPIHAVADVTHLLCATGWVGGLFCLAQLLRRIVRGEAEVAVLHAVLRRFSRVGYWTVALLLVSGCINGVILVPSVAKLIGTDYGRVLLVKIALALGMVTIALVNRFALTPKISAAGAAGVHALWRSVVMEQGVGLLVLVSVALLGTIHPVP